MISTFKNHSQIAYVSNQEHNSIIQQYHTAEYNNTAQWKECRWQKLECH